MGTFEIFLFTSLLVSSIWLIFVVISISNENAKLKERLRNEPESTYNIWLRALSNNLPMIFDNQHGKETKCNKNTWYFEDIAKKMSFKLSDLKPTEKDVALAFQKQQFEAKEQMYVEKIRQLEKILVAEEIKLSVDGQVTNMKADKLKYEKFELNLKKSHLENDVERLNSLLGITERKYVNLLDAVIYKHKNGITTVDVDLKKTREKIENLIAEANKQDVNINTNRGLK